MSIANMFQKLPYYFLLYGADVLSILLVVFALRRLGSRRSAWLWWSAALLSLAFIARTIYVFCKNDQMAYDFDHFWFAGTYAVQGKDPYAVKALLPPNDDLVYFLYPPHTLPFFKLFAIAILPTARAGWTVINVVICLSLGLMARQALIAQDGKRSSIIHPSMAALLATPVFLSTAANFCMLDGHLSFLVTFALLAALTTQALRPDSPAVTAAFLTLASIKVQTMAPFMLLFLRRRDLRVWLYLILFGIALTLAAGNPSDLPRKFSAFLESNAVHRAPGRPGDNSLLNPFANSMIGFEHVFYRLGIVDTKTAFGLALICILALGVCVVYVVNVKQVLTRGASCAMLSLYSMLFVYHRLYDLSILIIPLSYAVSRLQTPSKAARCCYTWIIAAILLVLNAPYGEFLRIQALHSSSVILRCMFLPSVTYLLLSAMLALLAAASFEAHSSSIIPECTQPAHQPKTTGSLAGQLT